MKTKNIELLNNDQVKEEISRHRWIESERAGSDIGFEKAAHDWLNRFSDAWLAKYKPELKSAAPKRSAKKI